MIYYPDIKTTHSELVSYKNLSVAEDDDLVIPIIQLTKPRLSKTISPQESLNRHIKRVFSEAIPKDKRLIITITDDETYQDANLSNFIHDSANGYALWIECLLNIEKSYNKKIIPTIIGVANSNNIENIRKQIAFLAKHFTSMAIRLPVNLDSEMSDLVEIMKIFQMLDYCKENKKVYVILDYGFRTQEDLADFSDHLEVLDQNIETEGWKTVNIPLFSSCPSAFPIDKKRESNAISHQKTIEHTILEQIHKTKNLSYGDFGYIHPIRKDGGGYWLPRIDYPAPDGTCYYSRYYNKQTKRDANKKLKITTDPSNFVAYRSLAKEMVKKDFFQNDTLKSWGRSSLIQNSVSSENDISGKSPSHYIAIRSNIHMERIVDFIKRLQLVTTL